MGATNRGDSSDRESVGLKIRLSGVQIPLAPPRGHGVAREHHGLQTFLLKC